MPFRIQNVEKKDVSDKSCFKKTLKNGKKLYLEEEVWYRWGWAIVEEDPRVNGWKEGEPLVTDDFNRINHHLEDGCRTDRYGVEDLSKKEQKLLEDVTFIDDAGWELYESEITFYGPVDIEEVEGDYL
jgi:hypothetical protein